MVTSSPSYYVDKKPNQTQRQKFHQSEEESYFQGEKNQKTFSIKEPIFRYTFQHQIKLGSACRLWNTHQEDILENSQFANVLH